MVKILQRMCYVYCTPPKPYPLYLMGGSTFFHLNGCIVPSFSEVSSQRATILVLVDVFNWTTSTSAHYRYVEWGVIQGNSYNSSHDVEDSTKWCLMRFLEGRYYQHSTISAVLSLYMVARKDDVTAKMPIINCIHIICSTWLGSLKYGKACEL